MYGYDYKHVIFFSIFLLVIILLIIFFTQSQNMSIVRNVVTT